MKKIIYFIWIVGWMSVATRLHAQTVDAIIIPPPQTALLTEFLTNPNLFRVIVTNKTPQNIQARIGGKLILDGKVLSEANADQGSIFDLMPGANHFNGDDVFKELKKGKIDVSQELQDRFRAGMWPAGVYEWCIEVKDANTTVVLLPSKCATRVVTSYQPATLTLPLNNYVLRNPATVLLRWQPVSPSYRAGLVYYEVSVFDVKNGQTPMQAFQSNFPIIQEKVNTTSMVWPAQIPLDEGQYIWTVRAKNDQDEVITYPNNYADPFTFSIVKNGGSTSNADGVIYFEPTFPLNNGQATVAEAKKSPMRFLMNLEALTGSSLEKGPKARLYMIEKKVGFFAKAALLNAIGRDRALYKSPEMLPNAKKLDVKLSEILPDSMAGKEFVWLLRLEMGGKSYDSEVFTFKYTASNSIPLPVKKTIFDCECKDTFCTPPLITDRIPVTKWKAGDLVRMGRFPLKINQLVGGNGTGTIVVPYAEAGIAVTFEGLQVNQLGQVLEGKARIAAASPTMENLRQWNTWQATTAQVADLTKNISEQYGTDEAGFKLPFSFKTHFDSPKLKLPFDLFVTNMEFSPEGAMMDWGMLVPNGANSFIRFGAKDVKFRSNGFAMKDVAFKLMENIKLDALKGSSLELLTSGSSMLFDCDGFKSFNLTAQHELSDLLESVESPNTPFKTNLNFNATTWGDFLATAALTPFRLKGVPQLDFKVNQLIYDRSVTQNPANLQLADVSKAATWQGILMNGVEARLDGALLPNFDSEVVLKAKQLLVDSNGVTTRLLGLGSNWTIKTNDWLFAVDSIASVVTNHRLDSTSLYGKAQLPYISQLLPFRANMQMGADKKVLYKFVPEADLEINLWKGRFKLNAGSEIVLQPSKLAGDKNWQPFANLNMEGSFNVAEDELDTMNLGLLKQLLGLNSLKFEMPKFSFKGFKINHPDLPLGQMLGFDKLDIFGDLKLGGLSINFLGMDFEDKEIMVEGKPKKAKGCVFRLSKGFDFDFKIWSTRNAEDSTKWDFAKFNFDFGLPKIECTAVPPMEVTEQTPAALAVNQIVKVGSFAMKVGQLVTETTKGFGTIRIPYLGSDMFQSL